MSAPGRRASHSVLTVTRRALGPVVRRITGPLHIRSALADRTHVALTFDDGPDPVFTPLVLDQLGRHGVRATFFLVGHRVAAHPDIVRRVLSEGHAVGSHTWSHPEPGALTWPRLWRDVVTGRRALDDVVGHRTSLFRPPLGHLDHATTTAVRLARLQPWLWTTDPRDWEPGRRTDEIVDIVQHTPPGGVVLLHDGLEQPRAPRALDRSATVRAIPAIVDAVKARGLDFAPLAE